MTMSKVLAVSGVKNSGKTTVLEGLVARLTARGLKVAVIKHDGHAFEPDRPGTDTFRHLAAGACGAAVFDGEKFQLVRRTAVTEGELIPLFPDADLILLEGFKGSAWPKVEVVRAGNSDGPVCRASTLLALVTDLPIDLSGVPALALDDGEGLADLVEAYVRGGDGR